MMAKQKQEQLVGHRVRVNDDACDRAGDPHAAAGLHGIVSSHAPGSTHYTITVERLGSVQLPLDAFTVLASGDSAAPSAGAASPAATLPLAQLVPSLTQPRKRFDADALQELAETIKLWGVMQPILVRKLPAARLADTFEQRGDRRRGEALPTHEIVAGERRWRASQLAGLHSIPVLERELTDEAVAVMQLVENIQRENLDPLDEAESFDRLIHAHGYTVEDIAATVRKGLSHVYETVRLLTLTGDARKALQSGALNRSNGVLISRVPTEQLQLAAFRDICPNGEQISHRAARDLVRRKYMLDLAQAPFDTADAELLPKAGDCLACPKRTGASPELFGDVKNADVCTDTRCFGEKKAAHFERMRFSAVAAGRKVISGHEAREIMPTDGGTPAGYMLLDKPRTIPGTGKPAEPLRQLLGQDLPADKVVLIETPSGAMVEAMPLRAASEAIEQRNPAAAPKPKKPSAAEQKAALQAEYEQRWRERAIHDVISAAKTMPDDQPLPTTLWQRLIRQEACEGNETLVAAALSMAHRWTDADLDTAVARAAEHPKRALLVLAAISDIEPGFERPPEYAPQLDAAALALDLDLAAIKEQIRADMKREAADRAEAAKPTPKPAAGKKPRAVKPKATGAEAMAGIAAAMQAAEAGTGGEA
ncbi:ParB/RepB/Spo0J family partition protein [Xylophilus ampelinus]|uniref:ParB family protein n=1 Tax=Xylophilus ampelinus TaxID=54067 RepID=A0A318SL21_9BURK|nr:ParB/RepB/Spo0J family partition protein [Xylophilus ampelinus]MCS4509171.1 ParB/RepB/Spo0J family partition protein [Xylophilus ampelinus]PYE79803.1 ParB family protein [Xylophilus ampelinus]